MRKLFGNNKRKKSIDGNLKIPVPMINGIEFADLPESQISTIISGGNKGYSSVSSHKTNSFIEKTPNLSHQQPVVPSRSISSPPILLMPKPQHSLPPTRFILKNIDFEKTQIESSSESSSDSEQEESSAIQEIYPSNIVATSHPNTIKRSVLAPPNEDKSPTVNQSTSFITRTSDDSSRQYVSASESPFFTASSVVSNKMNSPPLIAQEKKEFILTPTANVSRQSNASVPTERASSSFKSQAPSYEVDLQDFPKPPNTNDQEPPVKNVPLFAPIPRYVKKKENSRPPTSSSGSSATVGHDVTHNTRNSFKNNHDKPPENISSAPSAFTSKMSQDPYAALQELVQHEMKKMALDKDLQELKRAVEKMQQDRIIDLQENSARFEKQKMTEIEMWEHINMANKKLSKLIQDAEAKEQEQKNNNTPTLKSSNSTNTTRTNRSRASSNDFSEPPPPPRNSSMRQKAYKRNPRMMNDYFPDMKDRPPEFDMFMAQQYPPYSFYPPPQEDMRFPPYQDPRRKNRSRSMDPQWIPAELMDEYFMPPPPPDMFMEPQHTLSRKSSFHSAKSDDNEDDDKPQEKQQHNRMRNNARYRPMPPPMDNGAPLPPMYSNGTPGGFGPLPPHLARPSMEPPYAAYPPPPPPGNEYFTYNTPRMMFDEPPQQKQSQPPPQPQQQQPQQQPPPQQQYPFWGYKQQEQKENSRRRYPLHF